MISYQIIHSPEPGRPHPIDLPWTGSARHEQPSRTKPLIIAKVYNGSVIGYLRLSCRQSSEIWTIRGLAVQKSWHNQGIGGQLLRLAIRYTGEHCRGRQLLSFVRPDNTVSMLLHLGLGFTPISWPSPGPGFDRPRPPVAASERLHTCLGLTLPAAYSRYSSST